MAKPPENESNKPIVLAGVWRVGTWGRPLFPLSQAELNVSFMAAVKCWLTVGVGDIIASLVTVVGGWTRARC